MPALPVGRITGSSGLTAPAVLLFHLLPRPRSVWRRRVSPGLVEVVLSYCHCCLVDRTLLELLPYLAGKEVGVINASILSMGLLTKQARCTRLWRGEANKTCQGCRRGDDWQTPTCRRSGHDVFSSLSCIRGCKQCHSPNTGARHRLTAEMTSVTFRVLC